MTAQQLQLAPSLSKVQLPQPWIALRDRLIGEVADSISQIVLFGSQARKSAHKDSDVDLLIVVKERTPLLIETLRSIRYEVMEQYGFEPLLTLLIVSEEEWKNLPSYSAGLVVNIKKDGVPLWPYPSRSESLPFASQSRRQWMPAHSPSRTASSASSMAR